MRHDWMLDVLGDMRRYAQMHGMPVLVRSLDQTIGIAEREIVAASEDGATAEPDQETEQRSRHN